MPRRFRMRVPRSYAIYWDRTLARLASATSALEWTISVKFIPAGDLHPVPSRLGPCGPSPNQYDAPLFSQSLAILERRRIAGRGIAKREWPRVPFGHLQGTA